jgi:hypothetical protein
MAKKTPKPKNKLQVKKRAVRKLTEKDLDEARGGFFQPDPPGYSVPRGIILTRGG